MYCLCVTKAVGRAELRDFFGKNWSYIVLLSHTVNFDHTFISIMQNCVETLEFHLTGLEKATTFKMESGSVLHVIVGTPWLGIAQ